ncbi:OPT oligopeptide transporter protein-domain-containing protein [Scheffersomyces xylosifermentans]|uniref:OPT oligopeptide transporter protein-domain-containing protein n=1 Tax=Scheffersomyces xylosifermentans TaxID=1304137 RepID=UPI00315D077C
MKDYSEIPIGTVTSSGTHLELADHEVDLNAMVSNPTSIGDVGTTLTHGQKKIILRRMHFDSLVSLDELPPQVTFMIGKIESLSIEDSINILKEALVEHQDDVNIPTDDFQLLERLVVFTSGDSSTKSLEESVYDLDDHTIIDWGLQIRLEAALIAYHSPYPEVRAVTDPYDDPNTPCETIRVYIAGIIWTAISAVINQFFSQRFPSIVLSSSVVQIFLYPSGLLLEWLLPKTKVQVWKFTIDLNPGPWNYKEQMLATMLCSISGGGTSYVSSNIHVQRMKMFYNNQWANFGYQTLLILSTNFMGFGFAGIMRKFAVYPVDAIWPTLLPTIALNKALMQPEKKENINGWVISRYMFFFFVFIISFISYWVPNYLFTALSTFNWMTWIKPDNFNLAAITGSVSGLGLNPVPTFDWVNLNSNSALAVPFYSQVSTYIGTFLSFFVIIGVYWSNYKWTAYLPINSNSLFTNTGDYYSVQAIIDENSLISQAKYDKYGPPFYTAGNLVQYGAFFAIYPFAIFYESILNYRQIWRALKAMAKGFRNLRSSTYEGFQDPHTTMMKAYKEVPDWIFLSVLVISLVLAIVCVKIYPAETPVWGIFFAIGINFIFLIPMVAVYSRTGFSFGLNVLVELIVGYAIPGNGLALNFIKALGYNIDGQAETYITDQKMAHYVKLPPRSMFRVQILSVFIASFIQLGIMNFTIDNIKDYCEPYNKEKFTCADAKTFYNASIQWGVIGPKKVFGGIYPILQWCFLIGFLLIFPCLCFKKYAPKKYTKYFEPTLIIGGMLNWAPYNLSYFTGGLYLSIAFMYYIKKKYEAWWQKYNYLLSAGLTAGVALSSIIIFFSVQYHEKDLNWWGNSVSNKGIEGGYGRTSRLNATETAPDGYFGPRIGHFP